MPCKALFCHINDVRDPVPLPHETPAGLKLCGGVFGLLVCWLCKGPLRLPAQALLCLHLHFKREEPAHHGLAETLGSRRSKNHQPGIKQSIAFHRPDIFKPYHLALPYGG